VELHDKVIGHYLNIKHYQYVGVITQHSRNEWTLFQCRRYLCQS
ncbi:MAG TPA: hypothetical protein DEW00_06200, partial [Shigella sp.]|nr:hypothetical protein [Shigella sp.]